MIRYMTPSALRPEHFRVRLTDSPGWVWGTTRLPRKGEAIFCAAGLGSVKALYGKTGDGSRLVQIEFADSPTPPFFAAASNVLLPPLDAAISDDAPHSEDVPSVPTVSSINDADEWLGASVPVPYLR